MFNNHFRFEFLFLSIIAGMPSILSNLFVALKERMSTQPIINWYSPHELTGLKTGTGSSSGCIERSCPKSNQRRSIRKRCKVRLQSSMLQLRQYIICANAHLIYLDMNYTNLIHVHPIGAGITLQHLFRNFLHLALFIHQLLPQCIEQTLLNFRLRFAVIDDSACTGIQRRACAR